MKQPSERIHAFFLLLLLGLVATFLARITYRVQAPTVVPPQLRTTIPSHTFGTGTAMLQGEETLSPTPSQTLSPMVQTQTPSVTPSVTLTFTPSRTEIPVKPGWELVLNESFDDPALNTNIWNRQLYWGNTNPPELQRYPPDALQMIDGNLRITAEKSQEGESQYTSGVIASYDRFNFQYGYVEIRAKPPKGQGLWPALWMLSNNHGSAAEIDIMELLGHEPNIVHTTVHYGVEGGGRDAEGVGTLGPDYSEDFHVFAVDWDWEKVIWYIDGKEVFRITEHIPHEPLYLIANLAVGGEWPGNPDASTVFPAYFDIDYIRVWQQQVPSVNVLANSSFENEDISPWKERNDLGATFSLDATTAQENSGSSLKVSLSMSNNKQPWVVSISQENLVLEAGQPYTLIFWAKSSAVRPIRLIVQDQVTPFTEYTNQTVRLSDKWVRYVYTFTPPQNATNAMLNFNLADSAQTVWIDQVTFGISNK